MAGDGRDVESELRAWLMVYTGMGVSGRDAQNLVAFLRNSGWREPQAERPFKRVPEPPRWGPAEVPAEGWPDEAGQFEAHDVGLADLDRWEEEARYEAWRLRPGVFNWPGAMRSLVVEVRRLRRLLGDGREAYHPSERPPNLQEAPAVPDKARLRALAEAVVAAEVAYQAAWDRQERSRLAWVSRGADAALDEAMGSGVELARTVLALLGDDDG